MLSPKEIAYSVTKALDEKKGMNIKLLKIDKVSSLADYFLICTGTSNTHVKTLCDYAEYTLEQLNILNISLNISPIPNPPNPPGNPSWPNPSMDPNIS